MFKALIFDMDGVLIDSEPLHNKIEQDMLKELSVNLSPEEHYKFAGMGIKMWDILEKRYGYNRKVSADELYTEKTTRFYLLTGSMS